MLVSLASVTKHKSQVKGSSILDEPHLTSSFGHTGLRALENNTNLKLKMYSRYKIINNKVQAKNKPEVSLF